MGVRLNLVTNNFVVLIMGVRSPCSWHCVHSRLASSWDYEMQIQSNSRKELADGRFFLTDIRPNNAVAKENENIII